MWGKSKVSADERTDPHEPVCQNAAFEAAAHLFLDMERQSVLQCGDLSTPHRAAKVADDRQNLFQRMRSAMRPPMAIEVMLVLDSLFLSGTQNKSPHVIAEVKMYLLQAIEKRFYR